MISCFSNSADIEACMSHWFWAIVLFHGGCGGEDPVLKAAREAANQTQRERAFCGLTGRTKASVGTIGACRSSD